MKLVDMNINEYLEVLKSKAPAPGGGSVSALAGAQGIALLLMVIDLTVGKEKYKEYEVLNLDVKEKSLALFHALEKSIDDDTEAFNLVSKAFKMPKDTDEQKAERTKEIRLGTLKATEVPFSVMEMAYDGLFLVEKLVGKSNQNAVSDLGVAALNLLSCIQGAWLNVKINLPGVKMPGRVEDFTTMGQKIVDESEKMACKIYNEVLEML